MSSILKQKWHWVGLSALALVFVAGLLVVDLISGGDTETVYVSGLLAEYEYDSLVEESHLIVRGQVEGQSDSFQIIPVFGDSPSNFTDYYIAVDDVLRGDAEAGDTITVRVEGGKVGKLNVVVEYAPEYNIGEEVLLFLYKPNMGAGYNTEGDYYYTLGDKQGAFFLDKKDFARNTLQGDVFTDTDMDTSLVFDEVALDILEYAKDNPVDEHSVYNEFIENLNLNLETGFISQEEYDMYLAETEQYATIVE